MNQQSFQQLKQTYSKQRRREQLQKRFAQKRKQLTIQLAEKEKNTFEATLPIVNHQNYEENRYLLSDFVRSSEYSYQMLPIAFIAYEYLLKSPIDQPSWEILAYLSYYEDFQIPQTEEFAHLAVTFLNRSPQLSSQFLLNISKLPKCSLLCCRLIDYGIIEIIGEIVQKGEDYYWRQSLEQVQFKGKEGIQLQIFNLLTTLSYFFTLKPMLQLSQLKRICQILNLQTKSNKFLKQIHTQTIFRLTQNVIQDFTKQRDIIQLLVFMFQEEFSNSFFVYEQQIIRFLSLCVKNNVVVSEKLLRKLFISIKSKNAKSKVGALQLLERILIPQIKSQKMQIQEPKSNSLNNFIGLNSMPSLEEFSSMFSSKKEQPAEKKAIQSQLTNTLTVYSLLFTQNYQTQVQVLFQIYENSGQKIQQQIIILVKHIIRCLINEIHNYHPSTMLQSQQHKFATQNFEEFLTLTVEMDELFSLLSEGLKSSSLAIIMNVLEILEDVLTYFRDSDYQPQGINQQKINVEFIRNQCHKFQINSSLQYLLGQENSNLRDLVQNVIDLLEQTIE